MNAFPKIFALGTDYIQDIFLDEVEITEKIDGSQFGFGVFKGELYVRSKGSNLFPKENTTKMFTEGVDYIISIQDRLPEGIMFYAEYLKNPKHNILTYDRIPKNHIILFGACKKQTFYKYSTLKKYAEKFEIDVVPRIPVKSVNNIEEFEEILKRKSCLGDVDIEGVVVKNYHRPFLLGGQPIPLMAGKYVSEKFKETHREKWGKSFTAKGRWEEFKESFCTEARWQKAVQHLKEEGRLVNSPKDIGNLIVEVQKDIGQEEKENIKKFLWKEFGKEVLRGATRGMPEWYKKEILKSSFNR